MMQLRKQAFIRDQKKHEKEMRTLNADGTCGLWLGPFPGEIYLTRESAVMFQTCSGASTKK